MSGGNPFQTFYLLFKTNAKETKKDVLDLGEATEKVKKKTRDTKEEVSDLGKAFTDTVENAMRAITAYASFQAFKSGIVNAQEFNRALTIQTKLWGQNANEINTYGAAVKSAGGDMQGFFGWYDKIRQQNASVGRSTLPLAQLINHIRGQVRGASPEAAQMIFQQYGLGDPGAQSLLQMSDEQFEKTIALSKDLTSNTIAGAAAAQAFGKGWDNMTSALQKFWTTVNTLILPPLTLLMEAVESLFNMLADNKVGATAFFLVMAAGALAFTAAIPALIAGFGGIATAALGAAVPMALFLARLAAVIAVASAIPGGAYSAGQGIGHFLNRRLGRGDANGIMPGHEGYGGAGGGSSMDYLMNKHGLDADHAAGIVANLQHESGGDAGARGDGGLAHGLFQWHPDRRAKILAGTGIDVSNASTSQQLDAMIWEMKSRGQYDSFLSQKGAGAAGAYFSQRFEVPAGGIAEAMARGRTAMDIAASTPFSSGSAGGAGGSITIGKIDVNTQATDAAGIARDLHSELQRQIGGLFSQNNDAVAY